MAVLDIETSGQNIPEKSEYHSSIKDHSNNIAEGFNTIVIKTLNNESYKPSSTKNKDSNFDKRNNTNRLIMVFFSLIAFSLLLYLGIPVLLYAIIYPLHTTVSNYNTEVEFMIDINNDMIEETRYQHILVDTPDIHIEQETYDRKIEPLKKESNLPGENVAFNIAKVSEI